MIRRIYASSDIASRRLRAELTFIYGKVTGNLRRNVYAFACRPRGSSAKGFFLSPLLPLFFFLFFSVFASVFPISIGGCWFVGLDVRNTFVKCGEIVVQIIRDALGASSHQCSLVQTLGKFRSN